MPNRDEIINAIKRTASELGKRPSRSVFVKHTGISKFQVSKHFPSWNSAVEAAGLEADKTFAQRDDEALLEDWGMLVRELRHIPTRRQYRHHGKFSPGTFERHFGPWSSLPDKFRAFAEDKNEWNDVLAFLPVKKSDTRMTNDLSAKRKSISKSFPQKYSKLSDRPVFGNPIDFRGLRHEPVDEQGVVFLFGMVARELGYSVELVRSRFPDCEAKRQIATGKWQRVRIEFEYESRTFRDHEHSAENCDIIVCWRHNWPDCPSQIEVVELSEVIKQLAKSDE